MTSAVREELALLARAVRDRVPVEDVAARYGVALKRRGGELVGLCPFHAEKTPSFTVVPRKRFYHCFGCGAHGDSIGLAMRLGSLGFRDALEALAADGGLADPLAVERAARRAREAEATRARADRDRAHRRIGDARALWHRSRRIAGTPAETYLRARGIDPARLGGPWGAGLPPTLRFAPAAAHLDEAGCARALPAMVAAVQDAGGAVVAVHCTFLSADGRAKTAHRPARKIFGPYWGGAVRLGPAGPVLAVGEGIETCLSVAVATAIAGEPVATWAALSLGNLAGAGSGNGPRNPDWRPGLKAPKRWPSPAPDPARPGIRLPAGTLEVVLLRDADGNETINRILMARATRRLEGEGRLVRIAEPPAGMDFNDWLVAGDGVAA